MQGVPWDRIRKEYVAGDISLAALAEKYGVPKKTVEARSSREGWAAMRRKTWEKTREKLPEALSSARVKRFERVFDRLTDRLETAVFEGPSAASSSRTVTVTKTDETTVMKVTVKNDRKRLRYEDPKDLKTLIGAAKELSDALHQARAPGADGVTIEFSPEAEELAQ